MDNRPIGIFDSGVGGLSAVRALARQAPNESFVYFGDTARVPYGDREPAEIRRLARQDARFLRAQGIKALVIACNTITATAMEQLTADNPDIPVVGVIAPAAAQAVRATATGKIGVMGTSATVRSGAYERAVKALLPAGEVTAVACPRLVPLIESGHTAAGDGLLMPVLRAYLAPLRAAAVDTVVLGCTHYPLIERAVGQILGPEVRLVDSGAASIGAALAALADAGGLAGSGETGRAAFYCSARQADFTALAGTFLGRSVAGQTARIDIDRY